MLIRVVVNDTAAVHVDVDSNPLGKPAELIVFHMQTPPAGAAFWNFESFSALLDQSVRWARREDTEGLPISNGCFEHLQNLPSEGFLMRAYVLMAISRAGVERPYGNWQLSGRIKLLQIPSGSMVSTVASTFR